MKMVNLLRNFFIILAQQCSLFQSVMEAAFGKFGFGLLTIIQFAFPFIGESNLTIIGFMSFYRMSLGYFDRFACKLEDYGAVGEILIQIQYWSRWRGV